MENDDISCFSVLKAMLTRSREENIFWTYILRPIIYILLCIIIFGLLYLYCVPLTNIVGMGLFADYKCPTNSGVWGACGYTNGNTFDPNGSIVIVGFFVFLITLSTVGLYILGTSLYISSRRKGYVKKFHWDTCCSSYCCELPERNIDWIKTDNDQNYDCCGGSCPSGPYQYYTATICFAIATFISTIFIGTWVGRYIAVNSVSYCLPYQNTRIGLYGCVSTLVNTTTYVGGQNCNNCAGMGFAILGIPLFAIELLSISIFICLKKCKILYNNIKNDLVQKDLQKNAESVIDSTINKDDIKPNQCPICFLFMGEFVRLSCCHKTLCKDCIEKVNKCPYCRGTFNKNNPEIITISL